MDDKTDRAWTGTEVAIVGMAGRFPGAPDVDAYWDLLREGREASREFTRDELTARGVPADVLDDPHFVPRGPVLDGIDLFDAGFFGFSPRDAAIMDPQHRLFLECCWEALEHAGYDPARAGGAVGVFAGSGMHAYLIYHLATNPSLMASVGEFLVRHTGNDKDFLPTRVSYEFNLHGPSVGIQTACSTSLVAVHAAIQSLLAGESDLALAGGVSVLLEQENGYVYQQGEILSPDGHCRAFDADAAGTVFGSGVGVVVLKRLADALRDGDTVQAVLIGSAVNNDGRRKVGYLAPSVDGQAAVVAEALAVAGCEPSDISYIEAHGTGTPVGDPIEVAALTQAFGAAGGPGTIGIGSVKSNFGHLDTAAGVASLMKAAMAVRRGEIPASLHVRSPHPALQLESGPFYIADRHRAWPDTHGRPRRAGVSSLGVGGTNAHVVIEEPPPTEAGSESRPAQLLCLSARTDEALDAAARRLADYFRSQSEVEVADAAYTLQVGRRAFAKRRFVVVEPGGDAAGALAGPNVSGVVPVEGRRVAFLFAGGGAQHAGMARGLYEREPIFREALDVGLARLRHLEGLDLAEVMLRSAVDTTTAAALARPSNGLPALFLVQHALSALWESWGVKPSALIGHSAGEYAAAVLAGVMSFDDALRLVTLRGRLFETLPPGGMVSVALPEAELRARAEAAGLDVAAVNADTMGVVAGPLEPLAAFERELERDGLEGSRLHIDVAAHSSQVEGILPAFREFVRTLALSAPRIPIASNLTGNWLTAEEATDPEYWVNHLRQTVRFEAGLTTLLSDADLALLEVGPGRTLATLAKAHPGLGRRPAITSMRHPNEQVDDQVAVLRGLGGLWASGVDIDWAGFHARERRRRVPLPTYPFERQRYWIDRGHIVTSAAGAAPLIGPDATPLKRRRDDVSEWFAVPRWVDAAELEPTRETDWLVFDDGSNLIAGVLKQAGSQGARSWIVRPGEAFARKGRAFTVRTDEAADYAALVAAITGEADVPGRIVHAWGRGILPGATDAFFSVYHLVRAVAAHDPEAVFHLDLVTSNAQSATAGDAVSNPAGALLLGPATVLPAEFEGVTTRFIDVAGDVDTANVERELAGRPRERSVVVALRGKRRLSPEVAAERLAPAQEAWLPAGGACVITGGFGGMGLALARSVAGPGARMALIGRSQPPPHAAAVIRAIQEAGAEVLVLRADVTDRGAVAGAMAQARARFGHIDVVVHAAGTLDDAPIMLKEPARAAAVLAPKVEGTVALVEALAEDPPETLVLCSSVSARLGLAGQVDYAAANAFLDAVASGAPNGTRVVALGWGAWRDAGMAAALAGDDVAPELATVHCTVETGHPLLRHRAAGDVPVFEASISEKDWVADEHRLTDGRALLPGTAIVELARAAAELALGRPAELDSVVLRSPVFVDGSTTVRIHVDRSEDPAHLVVASRVGGRWTVHAECRVRVAEAAATGEVPAPPAGATEYSEARPFETQPDRLKLGPRWNALRRLHVADGVAHAELALEGRLEGDTAGLVLHPALLDLATGVALALVPDRDGLWVPMGYDRVVASQALPPRARVRAVQAGDASHETVRFDVELADEQGRVVATVGGLTMRRVDESALAVGRSARASDLLAEGISSAEGVDALARVLASARRGVVTVSPVPLDVLATPRQAAARSPLPDHAGDGAPSQGPRDEIEAFLVGQWSELLGATSVGLDDDFFDLGGHSLLALRLFARLEKRFGTSLPLATLFEAPTVSQLAERVRGGPIVGNAQSAGGATVPAPAREAALTHLVRVRPGGAAVPFFCVHGAGGNVLNFRDLARGMRDERAFYGLQARGVDGLAEPHDSIESMAEAYIAEIATVQPEGPYLLGGYSGGGVIAFEMARQLLEGGHDVAQVVFLDTFLPGVAAPEDHGIGERAGGRLQALKSEGPAYLAKWMRERWAFESWRFRERRLSLPRPAGKPLPVSLREVKLTRAFHDAADRYELRPLAVPIVLFTAAERGPGTEHVAVDLGWSPFAAAGLDIRLSPGTHDDLVREPNVGTLADSLAAVLREATAKAVTTPVA